MRTTTTGKKAFGGGEHKDKQCYSFWISAMGSKDQIRQWDGRSISGLGKTKPTYCPGVSTDVR